MKKTLSLLFTALFLLLCLLPSAGMLLFGESQAGANEVLAFAPKLRDREGRLNGEYLSDFSEYLSDRFYLRQELITLWNGINVHLLSTSPAGDVSLGNGDWLFYTDTLRDESTAGGISREESPYQSPRAARVVALMQEYVEAQGKTFLFTLAPNKSSLYPPRTETVSHTATGDFTRALSELGGNYLDLFAVFEREEEVLYFRTDSHWNGRGAALAADAILSALGKDGGWWAQGFVPAEPHRGDLYEMLYPAGKATEPDYSSAAGFTYTYTRPYRSPTDLKIETASEGGSGVLLCYRDSFGNNSFPYLAERFASATFSRQASYDLRSLDGVDAVVIELVERNLAYLLTHDMLFAAPRRYDLPSAVEEAEPLEATMERMGEEVFLRGSLPESLAHPEGAAESVYLRRGDEAWELTPQWDGYTGLVPADAVENSQIVYISEGAWVSAPLTVTEKE